MKKFKFVDITPARGKVYIKDDVVFIVYSDNFRRFEHFSFNFEDTYQLTWEYGNVSGYGEHSSVHYPCTSLKEFDVIYNVRKRLNKNSKM